MRTILLLMPGEPTREIELPDNPATIAQVTVRQLLGSDCLALAACEAAVENGVGEMYFDPAVADGIALNDAAMALRAAGSDVALRGPVLLIETRLPDQAAPAASKSSRRKK